MRSQRPGRGAASRHGVSAAERRIVRLLVSAIADAGSARSMTPLRCMPAVVSMTSRASNPNPLAIRAKTDRQPAELVLCRYALAAAALDFEAERQDRGRRPKRRTVRDLERDAKLGSRHRRLAECSEGRARPVRSWRYDRSRAHHLAGPDVLQLDREEHHVMRGFEARRRRRHGRQDGTELDELRGRQQSERIDRALHQGSHPAPSPRAGAPSPAASSRQIQARE